MKHDLSVGSILEYNGIISRVTEILSTTSIKLGTTLGTLSNASVHFLYSVAYGAAAHSEGN